MDQAFLKSKKIMLVDDEPELLKMLVSVLMVDGFTSVVTAATLQDAVSVAQQEQPALAVLDVMLPNGDGFSLMRQLRSFTGIPVIFLTAKDTAADKLAGLGLGADDSVVKPFLPQELLLRIHTILRRSYKEDLPVVELSGCTIDFSRAEVTRNGETLPLTAKEFAILQTLARSAGRIVTIDSLCEAVWGANPYGYENSLMAHIRRVREKIEQEPSTRCR